jgi:hypothetical protein
LRPLLFCLVLRLVTHSIQAATSSTPLALHGWCLDDGALVGPHATLIQVLALSQSPVAVALGLNLNLSKCRLFGPTAPPVSVLESYPTGLPEFNTFGIRVLVTPVGADDYVAREFEATLTPLRVARSHLVMMDDPQIELQLPRACFAMSKANHLCRTVPPPQFALFSEHFDSTIRASLAIVLQSPLSDQAWIQAGLALSHALAWSMFMRYKQRRLKVPFSVRWRLCTISMPPPPRQSRMTLPQARPVIYS